jgi:C-terminal processing protease CtpA/Prc
VAADTGEMIARHLRERQAAGAYRGISDPEAFATALTADLRAVNGDRHLRVRTGQADDGGMRVTRGGPADQAPARPYQFLDRVEVLPGNVGYLKLDRIPGAQEAFDEVARALRSFEHTDAMIIDLRGSRGGSAQMANFLISHFTRPGLLSLAVASRAGGDTVMRRTLEQVPGPRRIDVPLFVLIDSLAGSASEDIPFVLHNLGRATLIGQTTGGAGRNNRIYPLASGLTLSVSITRVWDPCTGREWERIGVAPDITVAPEQALEVALRAARDPRYRPSDIVPQARCRVQDAA